jgi:hypothetical protein
MRLHRRDSLVLNVSILCIAATLGGCAAPMREAVTGLGTSSDSEYGAFGMRFIRSVNATGLGAEEAVGTLSVDPDQWSGTEQAKRLSPFRTDLPDSMAPRLSASTTYVAERRFDGGAGESCASFPSSNAITLSDVVAIRDGIQGSQVNFSRWVSLESKMNVLAIVLETWKDASQDAPAGLLEGLRSLYPEVTGSKKTDIGAELDKVKESANLLKKDQENFKTSIGKAGIIITNWERSSAATGNVNVAEAKATGNGSKKGSGFLILGVPTATTLFFGNDFSTYLNNVKENNGTNFSLKASFAMQRLYVTHYQLRAKYMVFTESRQTELSVRAEADLESIKKALGPVVSAKSLAALSNIKLKIDTFYTSMTAIAEASVLDAGTGRLCVRDLNLGDDGRTEISAASGTIPVVSMRVAIGDYIKDGEQK